MADELTIELTGREVGRFADFTSMVSDLSFVEQACAQLTALMALPEEEQDRLAMRALWISSLVAYRRCFTSGRGQIVRSDRRSAIPDSIMLKLDHVLRGAHSTFLDIANKHIAHQVDDTLEQVNIFIRLDESPKPKGIFAVESSIATKAGGPLEQVGQLGEIATRLKDALWIETQKLRDQLIVATAQLDIEELYQVKTIEL